jgi:hypothetical protein
MGAHDGRGDSIHSPAVVAASAARFLAASDYSSRILRWTSGLPDFLPCKVLAPCGKGYSAFHGELHAEYHRLLAATKPVRTSGPQERLPGSFGALVGDYFASPEFRSKRPNTQKIHGTAVQRSRPHDAPASEGRLHSRGAAEDRRGTVDP